MLAAPSLYSLIFITCDWKKGSSVCPRNRRNQRQLLVQDEVWYQGDTSRRHLALRGERALGSTGRTWAMAENTRLQLPLNSEHNLSAERITLVIAHFELCCHGLFCLSLCLPMGVAMRGFGSISLFSFGFVLCKSSSFANCAWGEGRIRPWAVLCGSLHGDACQRVCQASYKLCHCARFSSAAAMRENPGVRGMALHSPHLG